jgi:DNA (cytosine-5)-methyltransferase 1
MTWPLDGFDAVHASPPCQSYSLALRHMAAPQPMLIDLIRTRLERTGKPWIIENVVGAPIPTQSTLEGDYGVMLCGTSFGLRVYRHRLFATSFPVQHQSCSHTRHAMNPHRAEGRDLIYEEFGRGDPELRWRDEMGVSWMGRHETREAIPPAYTEYIGEQLMRVLR